MNNEDIQRLITELRRMLVDNGFGWVVDEAETDLYPGVAPRTRAVALISAAESVTVNLADVELRALDMLEVEGMEFTPDQEEPSEGDVLVEQAFKDESVPDADRLSSEQRRKKLELLAEQRSAFEALRRELDGDE